MSGLATSAKMIAVTPEMARACLAVPIGQRRIEPVRVAAYARDMRAGRWRGQVSLALLTPAGGIVDGRHRFSAVIEAGVTVPMLIDTTAEQSWIVAADRQRPRRLRDDLVIEGVPRGGHLAAHVLSLATMEAGCHSGKVIYLTQAEQRAALDRYRSDLDWWLDHLAAGGFRMPVGIGAPMVFARAAHPRADSLAVRLATREGRTRGDCATMIERVYARLSRGGGGNWTGRSILLRTILRAIQIDAEGGRPILVRDTRLGIDWAMRARGLAVAP